MSWRLVVGGCETHSMWERFLPRLVTMPDNAQGVELWHGTSGHNLALAAPVPPATARLLRPRSQHSGGSIWGATSAPPQYLYLGDFTSAAFFGSLTAAKQQSTIVICKVHAPLDSLVTDPSAAAMFRKALKSAGAPMAVSIDKQQVFSVTGRVACSDALPALETSQCVDSVEFKRLVAANGVNGLLTNWQSHLVRLGDSAIDVLPQARARIADQLAICFRPAP